MIELLTLVALRYKSDSSMCEKEISRQISREEPSGVKLCEECAPRRELGVRHGRHTNGGAKRCWAIGFLKLLLKYGNVSVRRLASRRARSEIKRETTLRGCKRKKRAASDTAEKREERDGKKCKVVFVVFGVRSAAASDSC